jgi:hypothetical protein
MFVTRSWNFSESRVNHEWTRMSTNFGARSCSASCRFSLLSTSGRGGRVSASEGEVVGLGEGRLRVAPWLSSRSLSSILSLPNGEAD